MSGFKSSDFKVQEEANPAGTRIVKLEAQSHPSVKDFALQPIHEKGHGQYSAVKAKFGALAATDTDRPDRAQKDKRFTLSPLLRDPLSVEQEERRVIEERVRARVAALADEVRQRAHEEGYQAGLKQGHEESYKAFQQESEDRVIFLDKFFQEVEAAKSDIFRANERFLVELMFRISRTLLLKELTTDKEYVLRLARELIERVGLKENLKIKVNPEDISTINMLKEGLENTIAGLKNLTVETSNQIKRGGCSVETEWNAIDASIETQLQGVYNAIVANEQGV